MSEVKTVRFTALVQAGGQPKVVTLWSSPEQNHEFMKAVRENRVLTVFQPSVGTKKDFGMVGFIRKRQVSYFVFPRALPYAEGTKIIGIKYEQIQVPETHERLRPAPVSKSAKPKKRFSPALIKPAPPPARKKFRIQIRLTATIDMSMDVEAENEKAARAKGLAEGKQKAEFKKSDLTARVVRLEKIA